MARDQVANTCNITLFLGLLLLGSIGCRQNKSQANRSLAMNLVPVEAGRAAAAQSPNEGNVISSLESSLWSREPGVRTHAETELVSLAKSSPDLRSRIISELMKSVESQDELDG